MTDLPASPNESPPRPAAAQAAVDAIEDALGTVRKMRRGAHGMEDAHYETAVAGLEATRDYARRYLLGDESR